VHWFAEFLLKAVLIFAIAVSLVFTFHFLAEKRYAEFLLFAFLAVVFAGFALGALGIGDNRKNG
jgi:hypothetical protein